jgi:recombination DNA repair RAD52 pathway protein
MFCSYKKTLELKNTIVDLRNKLETSLYKIERLTTFYEETKEAEIDRLNNLVDKLSEKNDELSDAKEAARKELQKEYSDKVANIEDNYARKLEIEIESNTAKLEAIESQKSTEVENRIKE